MGKLEGKIALVRGAAATVIVIFAFALCTSGAVFAEDAVFRDYRFRSGATIQSLRIHYSTLGTPKRTSDGQITNAVLVLHSTGASGASMQTQAFRQSLYEKGRPLDATKYFLVFIDNVGHGQSSKPSDGLKARFPAYSYADMVDLQRRVLREVLGIHHLHAILGISMGGMNAWEWAERFPNEVDGIMPVAALPLKLSGRNLLWRRMLIEAIRSDPEWNGGDYASPPAGWLRVAPLVDMMLDGVPHLQKTLLDAGAADTFIRDSIARARARDANDVLYAFESSASYDPEPLLGAIKAKVYALNFGDDEFNPPSLHVMQDLIAQVPRARYVLQEGTRDSFGHLTMAHPELWAKQVEAFTQFLEGPGS